MEILKTAVWNELNLTLAKYIELQDNPNTTFAQIENTRQKIEELGSALDEIMEKVA